MRVDVRKIGCGLLSLWALAFSLVACGNPVPGERGAAAERSPSSTRSSGAPGLAAEAGESATPPFAVRGELDGLLLVWFDQEGLHTAQRRSQIPEPRRMQVRVDSLRVAPGQRLDPDHVYVADLSKPAAGGEYAIRSHTRAWFDAQVDAARPVSAQASAASDVTIYKASWCGACRATAAYLRSRNVPFVEKDIETDAEANAEMLRKAHAAGMSPSGVPVIDFRGHIILGFDQRSLDRLIL